MKRIIVLICALIIALTANAQTTQDDYLKKVTTIDNTIHALYDVISGPKGQQRDWDFLRYLFHSEAKLMASGKKKDGSYGIRHLGIEEYIESSGKWMLENGFFENELHRVTEQFGQIAHVFSTYESFKSESDEAPFMRGINSIQLLFDGERWWVLSVYFTQETPDNPIPEKYLTKP